MGGLRDSTKTMWKPKTMAALALVAALLLAGCGEGFARPPLGTPLPDPVPGDPWYGLEGNVLISDRDFFLSQDGVIDQIWIGFNRANEFQLFLDLHAKHGDVTGFSIGGRVIADGTAPLDFYFDPNTTVAAEVFAGATNTTLDQMKLDPAQFALNEPGLWNVPAVVEKVIDLIP